MVSQIKQSHRKSTIEKAQIDWPSTKTQMALAALLIIVSCFVAYGSTLKMGFLLDDFLHLDYAARALTGEVGPLINNFISNWGGSDIMKSYRPIVSLSIFIDYVLYHTHSSGFHLTNLIAFCACSVMVGLVTLEITGRLGSRSGALAALWAGLLFSVYPLHAESVAWIIGRVDTLATAFYLASVFCFLRLELLKEKAYLWRSLAFFLLALTSKEIAVSLPFAVALLACLPPGRLGLNAEESKEAINDRTIKNIGNTLKHAFLASLPYWLVLAAYALFRQALLGTAVGGYGGAGLSDLFHSLKIFADKDTLTKIFIPISEEFLPIRALAPYCLTPLAVIAAGFVIRQLALISKGEQKAASFAAPSGVIFWLALAVVPAFQIWHIYPNLVGSRLFFLSSAGLCISLALLALPAIEPLGKKVFSAFALVGLVALAALYLVWFYTLQIDLGAWTKASTLVTSFESQLRQVVLNSGQTKIVVLNLPQDYKGAGMVGRKLYLDILNRPPLIGVDLSARLVVLEPKITGSRDFIWPGELAEVTNPTGGMKTYIWSNETGALEPFDSRLDKLKAASATPQDLANAFEQELAKLPTIKVGLWQTAERDKPVVRKLNGNWSEISTAEAGAPSKDPEASSVTIWLPAEINPRIPTNWLLKLGVEDEHSIGMTSKCQAVWRNFANKEMVGGASAYFDRHHEQYLFHLGRYRSYLLSPTTLQLGLKFKLSDGPVRVKPRSLVIESDNGLAPILTMDSKTGTINWDAREIVKEDTAKSFDELRIFVTKPGTTIDPASELDLYQPSALEKAIPIYSLPLTGQNACNRQDLCNIGVANNGLHGPISQVVMVVSGKKGKLPSLPSQPVTLGE